MTNNIYSDGVLVYDRFYCRRPVTPLLVIKRILMATAFCVCSMMFILNGWGFPVSLPAMAAVCGGSCVLFSALFVFVKKRWVILGLTAISGLLVWWNFDVLVRKLSYFADACMLLVEGRFLYPRRFLFNRYETLDEANLKFVSGVALGTVILCALYGLIVALCTSGKLKLLAPTLIFVGLCVPMLISENLEFSLWLVPALAFLAGLFAICKNYAAGLAVKHSSSSDYRRRMKHEERTFLKHISSAPLMKRTEMRSNYYSKYFSSGMYCAALAAVSLMIGAALIPQGGSIDYTSVYEFIANLGQGAAMEQSPFDDGSASEFFSHSGDKQELLNVISPGRGERPMLHVQYTGDRPFYLRGDIGIDFTGQAWTTVVGSEPDSWTSTGLKENYRPCENRVISALVTAFDSYGYRTQDGLPVISTSDVDIEYLCDTDVVFLPSYTAEYTFYNNPSFNVFGDYAVRVSAEAGNRVNSVQCTALIPSYTSNERNPGDSASLDYIEQLFDAAGCTPDDIYSSVVPEMKQSGILSDYERYVYDTYLGIPDNYSQDILTYIARQMPELTQLVGDGYSVYDIANYVSEYLRTNYTYSLDGANNSRNPVMQFLEETRHGHCSLYASAMTLILREIGIPARYCTGFYVEAPEGSDSVMLKEKNLHAWVEVYIGQYGWVTFDPTSSAAYPDRRSEAVPGTSDSVTPVTDEPVSAATVQPTENAEPTADTVVTEDIHAPTADVPTAENGTSDIVPITPDEPQGPGFFEIIAPYIPAALAVIAAAAIIAFILMRLRKLHNSAREALERLRDADGNSRAILTLILELLEYLKLRPGRGELPKMFWHRVDEKLGTGFEELSELLEAMEFGSHETSAEEKSALFAQLEKLIGAIKPFRFPGNIRILRLIRGADTAFASKIP